MLYKQVELSLNSPKISKYIPFQPNCVCISAALRATVCSLKQRKRYSV